MTRIILLLVLAAGTGCMHVTPVGPLADTIGYKPKVPVDDTLPEPEIRPAPKPTPPALYVTPGEVTATNANDAVKRLQQELETDRRSMEAMPKYTDVSVVKGGMK